MTDEGFLWWRDGAALLFCVPAAGLLLCSSVPQLHPSSDTRISSSFSFLTVLSKRAIKRPTAGIFKQNTSAQLPDLKLVNQYILISGSFFRLEKEAIYNFCIYSLFCLSQSEETVLFLLGITGIFDIIQYDLNSYLEE